MRSLTQDDNCLLWLGTESGLYSYDGYLLRRQNLTLIDNYDQDVSFPDNGITSLVADGDSLLLGCNTGLFSFSLNDYSYHRLQYARNEPVLSIYKTLNQIWVVTTTNVYCNGRRLPQIHAQITGCGIGGQCLYVGTAEGVCCFYFNDLHLETLSAPVTRAKTFLPSLQGGALWIGDESRVILWDESNHVSLYELEVPVSKQLSYDNNGNILIGTDNGLYVVSERRTVDIIRHDARYATSLAGDVVWSIFLDCDRNLWIGTNCGLSLTGFRRRLFSVPITLMTGGGEGNQFFCIYQDRKGRTWLGGTTGLICVDDYRRNFRNYRWYRMGDAQYPIRHNRIRTITQVADGTIWVGGDGGMMSLNEATLQFERFLISEDAYNQVYDIRQLRNGMLQVTTSVSTYIGNPDPAQHRFLISQEIDRVNIDPSLQRDTLDRLGLGNRFYCYRHDTLTGRYFLGGIDEMGVFSPGRSVSEHPLQITDVYVGDKQYARRSDIVNRKMELSSDDDYLEFFFSDFDYAGQLLGNYYYRLGESGSWHPVRKDVRSVILANLRHGRYKLYIRRADTPDDAELEPLISFRIAPPWYMSLRAQLVYFCLLAIFIYIVYLVYSQGRRLRMERLHGIAQQMRAQRKEDELKTSNEYLQNRLRVTMREEMGNIDEMSSDDKFLMQITNLIREHLADSDLNVQRLSELSGVSTKQLYRRIKQLTGLTTVAYIRDLRLKQAAILLAQHQNTVQEVMYMVGFTCPSYFARCFYEAYGKSPSEYEG